MSDETVPAHVLESGAMSSLSCGVTSAISVLHFSYLGKQRQGPVNIPKGLQAGNVTSVYSTLVTPPTSSNLLGYT